MRGVLADSNLLRDFEKPRSLDFSDKVLEQRPLLKISGSFLV